MTSSVTREDLLDLLQSLPPLNEVAKWLDDYDRMGTVFLDIIHRSSDAPAELKQRALDSIPTIFSSEVQDDLRDAAIRIRLILDLVQTELNAGVKDADD